MDASLIQSFVGRAGVGRFTSFAYAVAFAVALPCLLFHSSRRRTRAVRHGSLCQPKCVRAPLTDQQEQQTESTRHLSVSQSVSQ